MATFRLRTHPMRLSTAHSLLGVLVLSALALDVSACGAYGESADPLLPRCHVGDEVRAVFDMGRRAAYPASYTATVSRIHELSNGQAIAEVDWADGHTRHRLVPLSDIVDAHGTPCDTTTPPPAVHTHTAARATGDEKDADADAEEAPARRGGAFSVEASIGPSGDLRVAPLEWIAPVEGYMMVGLRLQRPLAAPHVLAGIVTHPDAPAGEALEGCSAVELHPVAGAAVAGAAEKMTRAPLAADEWEGRYTCQDTTHLLRLRFHGDVRSEVSGPRDEQPQLLRFRRGVFEFEPESEPESEEPEESEPAIEATVAQLTEPREEQQEEQEQQLLEGVHLGDELGDDELYELGGLFGPLAAVTNAWLEQQRAQQREHAGKESGRTEDDGAQLPQGWSCDEDLCVHEPTADNWSCDDVETDTAETDTVGTDTVETDHGGDSGGTTSACTATLAAVGRTCGGLQAQGHSGEDASCRAAARACGEQTQGAFAVEGSLDLARGRWAFRPQHWLREPAAGNWAMVGARGRISAAGLLEGAITKDSASRDQDSAHGGRGTRVMQGCSTLSMKAAAQQPDSPLPFPTSWEGEYSCFGVRTSATLRILQGRSGGDGGGTWDLRGEFSFRVTPKLAPTATLGLGSRNSDSAAASRFQALGMRVLAQQHQRAHRHRLAQVHRQLMARHRQMLGRRQLPAQDPRPTSGNQDRPARTGRTRAQQQRRQQQQEDPMALHDEQRWQQQQQQQQQRTPEQQQQQWTPEQQAALEEEAMREAVALSRGDRDAVGVRPEWDAVNRRRWLQQQQQALLKQQQQQQQQQQLHDITMSKRGDIDSDRSACVPGDEVAAVWAGNNKLYKGRIAQLNLQAGIAEIDWADKDARHRVVALSHVRKGDQRCATLGAAA